MGISGSGMSAVAEIAKAQGFEVSGCDLKLEGHDVKHLDGIDLLCVTPAVFYQNADNPELVEAKKKNIVMTWQQFMGKYLHQDKFLICVAGTHGKSTTTAMIGQLLESANLDPTVEVGAVVNAWHTNFRIGQSKYFVSEADEFYDNFSTYKPDVIILTLLEFDHPEYFGTIDKMLESFQKFINNLKPNGTIIYNADSPLVSHLQLPKDSVPYHLSDFPKDFPLSIPGDHNKLNATAVIKLAELLKINPSSISNFSGLERRLQLLGETHGVKVYDDYANHPSSFSATITAVKQMYPKSTLWAIIEPHTYSRLRILLSDLPDSVKLADHVIISKIFASRESDPGDFTGQNIANTIPNALYIPEFRDIAAYLHNHTAPGDIVLVMGSGNSYQLSRDILTSLLNKSPLSL